MVSDQFQVDGGLTLRLYGSLRVTDDYGRDITPYKSAKGQGILALLAMAPNFERSREYLAAKLWSDRGARQAMGSLKTEIHHLRRSLGEYQDVLITRHGFVRLAKDRFTRDIDAKSFVPDFKSELLEGLRVRDPEFEEWLRETRSSFDERSSGFQRPNLIFQLNSTSHSLSHEVFVGGFGQSIADWCAEQLVKVDTHDTTTSQTKNANYLLNHKVEQSDDTINSSFSMLRAQDSAILWQHVAQFSIDSGDGYQDVALNRSINHRVDRTLFEIAPDFAHSRELSYLHQTTLGAVRLIYRNRGADMSIARRYLLELQKETGRGLHFAWLAYSLCFDKAEGNVETRELQDQAEELCQKALEIEPFNSMALALVSYTTTLILRNPVAGLELAKKSIELNRANPLAWSFCAAALYNLGKFEDAFKSADYARKIAGDGPYRYAVETFYCIAATLSNRIEEAIYAGEAASILKPDFKAAQRYLAMLYSYKRDEFNLDRMVKKLRMTEPDFSVRKMLEVAEYPSEILRQAAISKMD